MTALVSVTTDGMSREDWLDARRRGIGGSDAAAVVGLHPWVSPLALYFDKSGEYVPPEHDEPNEPMEWGLRLEAVVADAWAEKNGRRIQRVQAILQHPDYPFMLANLDRVVVPDESDRWEAVLEIKTASGWSAEDWAEGVPPHVVVQVQHQLAVTGLDVAHVACLVGGSRYLQDVVERDDELIGALIEREAAFWDRVQRRDPPAADSHPSTSQVLKARWDETLAEAVELGEEGLRLVRERHAAKAAADGASKDQAAAENRLKQLMAEREVATVYGEIAVTWRPDKNGTRRFSVKEIL